MTKTKYHLFMGDTYYPSAFPGDYEGTFDSIAACKAAIKAPKYPSDWYVIVNADDMSVVEGGAA